LLRHRSLRDSRRIQFLIKGALLTLPAAEASLLLNRFRAEVMSMVQISTRAVRSLAMHMLTSVIDKLVL
jgi:hypothetical protein